MPELVLPRGWLDEAEQEVLRELAQDRVVLEVGSYLGRSTVVLAEVAQKVISVDTHTGNPENYPLPEGGKAWSFPSFWENITDRDLEDRVIAIVADFAEAAYFLKPFAFGLVYIDADHSYEATMQLGRLGAALAGPGAPVVFHDYDQDRWPGVVAAVDELSASGGRPVYLAGSLARLPIITAGIQRVPRTMSS